MSSRWKKVLADFWGNRSRTALTILMIAVGTFAVGFNSNMGLYMNESMDSDFLSALPSEALVYAGPLNDDMVAAARKVPGVQAVEGFSSVDARIVQPDGSLVDIQFTALDDPNTLTVNLLKPLMGEKTLPKYRDQETIFDGAAASLGYRPGDRILLELEGVTNGFASALFGYNQTSELTGINMVFIHGVYFLAGISWVLFLGERILWALAVILLGSKEGIAHLRGDHHVAR